LQIQTMESIYLPLHSIPSNTTNPNIAVLNKFCVVQCLVDKNLFLYFRQFVNRIKSCRMVQLKLWCPVPYFLTDQTPIFGKDRRSLEDIYLKEMMVSKFSRENIIKWNNLILVYLLNH
jgi:hypothetical protein